MKMRIIILQTIGYLLFSSLLLTGCDALEESPKNMVVENFYKTPEEVETATNAIYHSLRAGECMAVYEATLECMSDCVYGRGSWAQIGEYSKLNDTNITRVGTIWKWFYLAIRNANLVIQRSPAGDPAIDVFVAEAHFLRAFSYFQIVRNWGGVPLRTDKNLGETDVPKSTIDDVYKLIIDDLSLAEGMLPEKQGLIGRPTKWAAKTLLADVYLHLEKYGDARAKAEEVMASRQYSLVPAKTKEDFQNNVFGPALLTTSEEIFYLKYSNVVAGQSNYLLWITNHASTGGFPFGGAYVLYMKSDTEAFRNWDEGDLRRQLWSHADFGLGDNTYVSAKFIDKGAISQNGGANDDPVYGYSDLLLIYAEGLAMEKGNATVEAMEAVNQIRRRAYGYDPLVASEVDYKLADYASADKFRDLVIKERGYEFQLEGKRWLELKRTGKAQQVINAEKGYDVDEISFLWPFPVDEINYNTAIDPSRDQNPGY